MARNRALLALLLLAAASWTWLAFAVHTVEIGGGELDQYVLRARAMLAGSDNQDAYHPAGLPVWIAALAWFGIEPFAAARALAIGFGVVLLWASHGLARLWLPSHAALVVAAIVGLSPIVLVHAVQACSDVPAAAMATVALLHWCRAARDGATTSRLVSGGLAIGVAASFRSPALWLLLGWLPLLRDGGFHERLRRCLWTGGAILVGMLPHLLWFWHVFGSPLHNEAWVSLLLKFHFDYDVPAWVAAKPHYAAILDAEWTSWLWPALRDALVFLATGLGAGLGVGGGGLPAVLLSLAVAAAWLHALLRGDRARAVLALAALGYAMLLAATFRPIDRFLIPLVLPAVLLLALPLARGRPAVLLLLLAAVVWRAPAAITHFVRSHPHAELAAVAALRDELGEPLRALVRPFCAFATADPWLELRRELHAHDQEFVVLSRTTSAAAIAALRALPTPPDFRIRRDDELLVLDASATPEPWLAAASAEPRDGALHLRLELHGAPTEDAILMAGFLIGAHRGGELQWQHVPLPATGERTYELVQPVTTLRGVRCRLVPAVIHASGMIRRGEPFEVVP